MRAHCIKLMEEWIFSFLRVHCMVLIRGIIWEKKGVMKISGFKVSYLAFTHRYNRMGKNYVCTGSIWDKGWQAWDFFKIRYKIRDVAWKKYKSWRGIGCYFFSLIGSSIVLSTRQVRFPLGTYPLRAVWPCLPDWNIRWASCFLSFSGLFSFSVTS